MKEKSIIIKTIELFTIILLYHITKNSSIFLYVITLSLYKIFMSCFSHITLKNTYENNKNDNNKLKLVKYTIISITIIYLLFILLSIFISDTISNTLNIENTFMPYLFMSISIITEPTIKLLLEYLESYKKVKLSKNLLNTYYIIENILLIIVSILTFILFKIPTHIAISMLYLSKIISFIIVLIPIYISIKKLNIKDIKKKINYKEELKSVITSNSIKSIIKIVKKSYCYISIILLYIVLSNRYKYKLYIIEKDITFIYLYGIYIINYIISGITLLVNKKDSIINYIYQ